jgi:hypothetical protein
MKGILAISLASILMLQILLPAMDVRELTKLPDLLQHYHEHKAENPSINFLSFLKLHYTNASHHEQDHERHHELPFTNHHAAHSAFVVFTITTFETSFQGITESEISYSFYTEPAEKNITFSIWQPPKV